MTKRALLPVMLAATMGAASLVQAAAPTTAFSPTPTGVVRAGVATADISWHVGAGQGQYGSTGNAVLNDRFDPNVHGTKQSPSDGIQARLYARALVVEGPDGERIAYVKHDLYLQQDLLHRRVAELVAEAGTGIDRERLMIGATHNHSAPYFATTSWGVWLFTDTFDYRQFDYLARGLAGAVIDAANDLRPVRMGAAVVRLDEVQQNILGPGTADDGTPAGFPRDHFDDELAVVRFDDVSDPELPKPLAAFVNLGMHPESLATSDMYSPDFVGMVERMVGRDTGATIVWSQGAVGDVEPDRDARAHPPSEQREYWHRDFSQAELMSRIVAARVADAYADVASATPEIPEKHVPFSTSFPVAVLDMTFAGPPTHALPTYGNCKTDPVPEKGQARVPGLPTCVGGGLPVASGQNFDALRGLGVPVPNQYAWTAFGAVHETLQIHLQVMRLGQVVLATCPCEPISDMTINFKSRADATTGNIFDGFDWPCRLNAGTRECNFKHAAYRTDDWRVVNENAYQRMVAQIHNDAAGWEDPDYIAWHESEPTDVTQIKGNYTKEELDGGFTLPLMVGQANDYIGYIVTYREYMAHDHYRKALTAFGPHTSDYVNTRLVRMAGHLLGGPAVEDALLDPALTAEDVALQAKLLAAGRSFEAARAAYEAALPDDGGTAAITSQPATLQRFGAAQVRWIGGANYNDNPVVRVERLSDVGWETFATQEGGEIVVTYAWRKTSELGSWTDWVSGQNQGLWTATFEVFDETPDGRYRFMIDGAQRKNSASAPYALTSNTFDVMPWTGIQVGGGTFDGSEARFTVAPITYPATYSPVGVRYITTATTNTGSGTYCLRCTFRPWAKTGVVASARVTVRHADGTSDTVPATWDGSAWVAPVGPIAPDDQLFVAPGDVVDAYGNVNGTAFRLG